MEQLLLRPGEAARVLSLGRSKLYELLASGELPSVKIGRATRIPAASLRDWVERRASGSGDGADADSVP
jgi:excisionase family DNA binding protein